MDKTMRPGSLTSFPIVFHLLSEETSFYMDHLFSVLPKVLRKRGLEEHAKGSFVVFRAMQWLEEHLPLSRESLRVHSLKDGTLTILCTHSIAAQECHSLIPDLLQYLKQDCGFTALKDVRIIRG